ncbi:hypothetical protein BH09PAT1_BH09PAT1_3610 [soil metagenome]
MSDVHYIRPTQKSVTCFIYHDDEFLFLERNKAKKIDPGKLNGVGGRIENGEDYIAAAVREIEEETGYKVNPKDLEFCGMFIFQEGFSEDWVAAFFKVSVPEKIQQNTYTNDGILRWIHKDEVLKQGDILIDDLHYCFEEIVNGEEIFFANCDVDENFKINRISKNTLKNH